MAAPYKKRNNTRVLVPLLMFQYSKILQRRCPKREWVKKWKTDRDRFGHMPLLRELRENYPDDYRNYLRMDAASFDKLLSLTKDKITKEDTVMRRSISAEERLSATLRYLATGRSLQDIKFSTGIAVSTLCTLIPETCIAIFESLKEEYMKFPETKEEWLAIAKEFEEKWQFVNCGGAFDGKHIRIVPPPNSGAQYYNYKHFYSIVLMALVNAKYEFIFVDVGKNGRISDGGVIEYTEFYRKLQRSELYLPENHETVKNLNFVFLGDEAFSLHKHFLKPFPSQDLNSHKRIFNYRLSRARNVSENCFGQMTAKFRIFHTAIHMAPEKINHVVLAVCALHNFLIKMKTGYISQSTFDKFPLTTNDEFQRGEWRENYSELANLQTQFVKNSSNEAKTNRENYMQYFNSSEGQVEWQEEMIKKGKA